MRVRHPSPWWFSLSLSTNGRQLLVLTHCNASALCTSLLAWVLIPGEEMHQTWLLCLKDSKCCQGFCKREQKCNKCTFSSNLPVCVFSMCTAHTGPMPEPFRARDSTWTYKIDLLADPFPRFQPVGILVYVLETHGDWNRLFRRKDVQHLLSFG